MKNVSIGAAIRAKPSTELGIKTTGELSNQFLSHDAL